MVNKVVYNARRATAMDYMPTDFWCWYIKWFSFLERGQRHTYMYRVTEETDHPAHVSAIAGVRNESLHNNIL